MGSIRIGQTSFEFESAGRAALRQQQPNGRWLVGWRPSPLRSASAYILQAAEGGSAKHLHLEPLAWSCTPGVAARPAGDMRNAHSLPVAATQVRS